MKILYWIMISLTLIYAAPAAKNASKPPAPSAPAAADSVDKSGYRIDEPGTITFTMGVTIKGKIEKPQVVIFLPKERSYYRPVAFSYSYKDELLNPLPFTVQDFHDGSYK